MNLTGTRLAPRQHKRRVRNGADDELWWVPGHDFLLQIALRLQQDPIPTNWQLPLLHTNAANGVDLDNRTHEQERRCIVHPNWNWRWWKFAHEW